MRSRSTFQSTARLEALLKAVVGVVVVIALGIGGLGNFVSVLSSLALFLGMLVVVGGGVFFVLRSRLIPRKKAGLCLIFASVLLAVTWQLTRLPAEWTHLRGTVSAVNAPGCTVEVDYEFRVGSSVFRFTRSKHWRSPEEARRSPPANISLFYNPRDPRETDDHLRTGLTPAQATPIATRAKLDGAYQATLTYGLNIFSARRVTVSGDAAAQMQTGSQIELWVNPANPEELSLVSKETVGGQRYPLLWSAIALLTGGLVLILSSRQWRTDLIDGSLPGRSAAGEPPAAAPLSVVEQLERIDWYQLEAVVARILELQGWQVERRGGARPDGGADLVAKRDQRSAVVQVKHWKRVLVDVKIVRELLGTMASSAFKADGAMLFTFSPCTPDATRFAAENGITIVARAEIVALIEQLGKENFPQLAEPDKKCCPKCESPMIWREAAQPFWGCSRFPRCRGKIDVSP